MKLLVVSDSHGNTAALEHIIGRETPFDYLVHCGDGARDLSLLRVPDGACVIRVSGNMDRAAETGLELREIFEVRGLRVMATHGDRQRVHIDCRGLLAEAESFGADLVLFGHTHRLFLREERPFLFNPGAALQGRYGVVLIDERIGFFHKRTEEAQP